MTRKQRARLYAARELVVIDLLKHTLVALRTALVLEHPTLDDQDRPANRAPVLRRARALARAARLLAAELRRYRRAVNRSLEDIELEQLPF
jgi:hypothetical protein